MKSFSSWSGNSSVAFIKIFPFIFIYQVCCCFMYMGAFKATHMSALIKSQLKHYLPLSFFNPSPLACLLKIQAQSQNECGSKSEINKEWKRESEGREGSQSERRKIVKYMHCVTRTKPRTLVSLASYLTFDILKTLCIFSHICLTKWRRQREHKGSRGVENREKSFSWLSSPQNI